MSARIDIHQIYYQPEQQALLDPDGVPFDNCANPNPDWCEYHIFREAYKSKAHLNANYTGYVSWKFNEKTGISLNAFKAFIHANPGYDVYAINPFPLEALRYKNSWCQGERAHKKLLPLAKTAWIKTNKNTACFEDVMPHHHVLYCNYWVGNPQFWDTYMAFAEPIYRYFTEEATLDIQEQLRQKATRFNNTIYAPYIIERLLSSLIHQPEKTPSDTDLNLKICIYPWSAAEVATRYHYSSENDIQRLFALRQNYERQPTAYKENVLYALVKLVHQDKKSYSQLISWAEAAFENPKAPTAKRPLQTKLNLHLRQLSVNTMRSKSQQTV